MAVVNKKQEKKIKELEAIIDCVQQSFLQIKLEQNLRQKKIEKLENTIEDLREQLGINPHGL